MEIKLVIDGSEFKMGSEFLQDMVSSIPDTPVYEALYLALAKNTNSAIRTDVAWKDSLSHETVQLLLKDKNTDVLDRILNNSKAESIVSGKQLKKFIALGDTDILKTIIQNISSYENINIDEVVDDILELRDPGLTLALASGWNIPKRILKKLAKFEDADIAYTAKKSLE